MKLFPNFTRHHLITHTNLAVNLGGLVFVVSKTKTPLSFRKGLCNNYLEGGGGF